MRKIFLSCLVLALSACSAQTPGKQGTSLPFLTRKQARTAASSSQSSAEKSVPALEVPLESGDSTPAEEGGMKRIAESAIETPLLSERLLQNGILEAGDPGAPRVLLTLLHQSCGYCKQFFLESFPRLQQDFLEQGLLRYQLVLVPFRKYPESDLQGAALLCAAEQGAGIAMHERMFLRATLDRKAALEGARELTLNRAAFEQCLDAQKTRGTLAKQQMFIDFLDVTLVPTFFLDGEKFVGLPRYPDLRGKIEEAIASR